MVKFLEIGSAQVLLDGEQLGEAGEGCLGVYNMTTPPGARL